MAALSPGDHVSTSREWRVLPCGGSCGGTVCAVVRFVPEEARGLFPDAGIASAASGPRFGGRTVSTSGVPARSDTAIFLRRGLTSAAFVRDRASDGCSCECSEPDGSGSATLAGSGEKKSAAVAGDAGLIALSAGFLPRAVFGFSAAGETPAGTTSGKTAEDGNAAAGSPDASAVLSRDFRAGFLAGRDVADISKLDDTGKVVSWGKGEASLVLRFVGRFGGAGKTSGEGTVVGSVIGEEKGKEGGF